MNKYKKIVGLMVLCVGTCLFGGCNHSVIGDVSDKISSSTVKEPINPNNEEFTYIDSTRTVSGDIITITFQYKLEEPTEEPKEDELPEFGLSLQP